MKHLFLSCILASALSVNAQTTFYVDQSNPAASDTNAGTADAPWSSLNTGKWTDGCTVIIKGEYYIDAEADPNEITVDATLEGRDNAIIYGYEPDDEEPADYNTFFTCTGHKLSVKNLAISNYNNTDPEKGSFNGGVFSFGDDSELILDNVTISNVFHGCESRRGGAISTSGKLTATNVRFENCTACQGGAIAILGNNPAKFISCSFIGNNNDLGIECWAKGGVFYVNGNDEGSDITIDRCYFEGNTSDCEGYQDRKYSAGGVMALNGAAPKLHISNSTFYGNIGGWAAGVLFFEKYTADDNNIDIRFTNNTFLDNTVLHSSINHGVLVYFNGASTDKLHGLLSFVNNTSFNNNTPNEQSVIYLNSCPLDVVLANNLSLDKKIIEDGENSRELGYGWVLQENNGFHFTSVQITHNIIEGGIGGGHKTFDENYLTSDETANIFPKPAADLRPTFELATELVTQDDIHFLPVGEYSSAIDAGTNNVVYAGANLVTSTDILGNAIVNGTRDIGAWEFGNSAGIENTISSDLNSLNYDRNSEYVTLQKVARYINVYDITGSLVASVSGSDSISLALLPKGIFIVIAIVDNTPVTTKILR